MAWTEVETCNKNSCEDSYHVQKPLVVASVALLHWICKTLISSCNSPRFTDEKTNSGRWSYLSQDWEVLPPLVMGGIFSVCCLVLERLNEMNSTSCCFFSILYYQQKISPSKKEMENFYWGQMCKVTSVVSILCDLMDRSLPGFSVYGIFQAGILEWVAMPFTRGLPNPGIKPRSAVLQVDAL